MIVYKIWEVSVKAYLAIHINNAIDPLKLWCLFDEYSVMWGNLIFIKKHYEVYFTLKVELLHQVFFVACFRKKKN